jgi:hypothetical protein
VHKIHWRRTRPHSSTRRRTTGVRSRRWRVGVRTAEASATKMPPTNAVPSASMLCEASLRHKCQGRRGNDSQEHLIQATARAFRPCRVSTRQPREVRPAAAPSSATLASSDRIPGEKRLRPVPEGVRPGVAFFSSVWLCFAVWRRERHRRTLRSQLAGSRDEGRYLTLHIRCTVCLPGFKRDFSRRGSSDSSLRQNSAAPTHPRRPRPTVARVASPLKRDAPGLRALTIPQEDGLSRIFACGQKSPMP